jgi:hypothetical protein
MHLTRLSTILLCCVVSTRHHYESFYIQNESLKSHTYFFLMSLDLIYHDTANPFDGGDKSFSRVDGLCVWF